MENELQLVNDQQGAALPVPQQQLRTSGSTPADLIRYAMESGADLDRLERLMQMQIDWEKREAEKAFHDAMAIAKITAPDLTKQQVASFPSKGGNTSYDYSSIGDINPPIVKWLAENGFNSSWEPDQNGSTLGITCVLTHKKGFSKRYRLEASHDNTGSKNSIQAMGSTQTYLERYTLLGVTGLSIKDGRDDDGKSFSKSDVDTSISDEWIAKLKDAKTDKDVLAIWNAGAAKMEKLPRDFEDFQNAVAERRGQINDQLQ